MFKISRTKEEQPKPAAPAFTLPLLPLRDIVVFPSMVVPLFVGATDRSTPSNRP